MDEIKERFAEALSSDDIDYIEEFNKGREAAEAGGQPLDSDSQDYSQGYADGYESINSVGASVMPVQVGLHPLGGVAIQVQSVTGDSAQARLTVEEAWNLIGHVNALTGMLIQMAYAQQIQEQQNAQKLIIPGGNNGRR